MTQADPGRKFEERALTVARARHDPLALQGPQIVLGRERDAVFVNKDTINVYEFTTRGDVAKAQQDGKKLAELIKHLKGEPANRQKSAVGWFVTAAEPSAEQRGAIDKVSKEKGVQLHAISFSTLRSRLCDVEGYIARRGDAPFGSLNYAKVQQVATVAPKLRDQVGELYGVKSLAVSLQAGARFAVTGEFGVGKSFTLRQLFFELRKRYFAEPALHPFPVHIKLRDCFGLRSPAEVLRRHSEDIGFDDDRQLLSAWRAGACVLLLDGFDEIIPHRWLGPAGNLRAVRRDALSPVRRLVQESPDGTGVIVAGRLHYFSSGTEQLEALGLEGGSILRLEDFDAEQARAFLSAAAPGLDLPEWLPARPLLLAHLLHQGVLPDVAGLGALADPSAAWRGLFAMICKREANNYMSVEPDTIQQVLRRLATLARASEQGVLTLTVDSMADVFADVSGRAVDEEVVQLLTRLPGLALASTEAGEARVFADDSLSDVAYGEDLALYAASPYQGHALTRTAGWSEAARPLAIGVAGLQARDLGLQSAQILAACDQRMNQGQHDVVLFDLVNLADEMGAEPRNNYYVEGVSAAELTPTSDRRVLAGLSLSACLIEVVDVSQREDWEACPTLTNCDVDLVRGVVSLPNELANQFIGGSIAKFEAPPATTTAILDADLSADQTVALLVLQKVYQQRGAGRKESGLYRGQLAAPTLREHVQPVITRLLARGYFSTSSKNGTTFYHPIKDRRAEVEKAIESKSLEGF